MATKLEELGIDEVSGVERPANETPGWVLMKSEELLKQVDRVEADFAILYSALTACEQYLAETPQEIQDACSTLKTYIESLFDEGAGDAPNDDTGNDTDATPTNTTKNDMNSQSLLSHLFKSDDADDVTKDEVINVADEDITDDVTKTEDEVTETAETDDVTKTEDEVTETAETDDVTKTEDGAEIPDALVTALERLAKGQEDLVAAVAELREDTGVAKDAVSKAFDRLRSLEVQSQIIPVEETEDVAKSGPTVGGSMVQALRQPGRRVTLN